MEGQKAFVFYAKSWNMTDERTGQQKQGVTVEYIIADSLNPVLNDDGSRGFAYVKQSLSIDKLQKIGHVPGYYNLIFGFKPNSKGKVEVSVVDLEFAHDVKEVSK